MIRIVIIAVIVYIFYRALKSWIVKNTSLADPSLDRRQAAGQIDDVMVKDPNCDAYFPKRKGVALKMDGQELLFCSEQCRNEYIEAQSKTEK
jgi:hypothetical protein